MTGLRLLVCLRTKPVAAFVQATVACWLATGLTVRAGTGPTGMHAENSDVLLALSVAVAVSLLLSVVGVAFAPDILRMMGASDAVVTEGSGFTRIMLGGNLAIILLFLINGIFRGAGDASMAMFSLWVASGINIVLCPILVNAMGV